MADDGKFDFNDVMAGGYSALDSALFGIPDVLVKAASSDAYAQLKKLREENKIASTVGEVAGMFAPTGGALFGLAGKGLKAAGKMAGTGRIAKGLESAGGMLSRGQQIIKTGEGMKGIGGAAIRGGVTAAEQALPRMIGGTIDPETGLENFAMGTALGGGLGALGKLIPARSIGLSKGKLGELVRDTALSGRGVATRDLRKAMTASAQNQGLSKSGRVGSGIQNADEVKDSALALAKKYGLETDDDIADFLAGEGAKWDDLARKAEASGLNMETIAPKIAKNPEIQALLRTYGKDAQAALQEALATASTADNITDIKAILQKNIKMSAQAPSRSEQLIGDMSRAIKGDLEDEIFKLDPNYGELKETWKAVQPLRQMAYTAKTAVDGIAAKSGSDTAMKMAAMGALGGTAVGGFDPNDPETWGQAAMSTIGGAAGGSILNRVAPQVINKVIGKSAEAIQDIAPKVSPLLSRLEKPVTALEKGIGARKPSDPVEVNKPEAIEAITPAHNIQIAKDETNAKYMGVLDSVMRADYENLFADQMSFEDFKKQVGAVTNDFDPKATAAILFKDPKARAKYLKDYTVAMQLKNAQVDVKLPDPVTSLIDPKNAAEQRKAYADFMDSISSLVTDSGNLPSAATKKQIQADVKAIADLDAAPDEKRQLLFDKLGEKYGMDIGTLRALGMV